MHNQVVVMFFSTLVYLLASMVLAGLVQNWQDAQRDALSKHQMLLLVDMDDPESIAERGGFGEHAGLETRSVAVKARLAIDAKCVHLAMHMMLLIRMQTAANAGCMFCWGTVYAH
jgi:hypothetical protein